MTLAVFQQIRKKLVKQRPARVAYYTHNIALDASPQFLFRKRLRSLLTRALAYDQQVLASRVNYYNKLQPGVDLGKDAATISNISLEHSFYYYDLKEHARYFPRSFRLHYLFSDVTIVPEVPSIVKSRPIGENNRNSAIMKLDKFRHLSIPIEFPAKVPK